MTELENRINSLEQALLDAEQTLAKLKLNAIEIQRELRLLREEKANDEQQSEQPEPSSTSAPKAKLETSAEQPVDSAIEKEDPTPPIPETAEATNGSASAEEAQDVPGTISEAEHEAIIRTIESLSKPLGSASKSTIEDRYEERPTLGDRMGAKKLNDLKRGIGINERFLYANELFGGDMKAFSQALDELNHVASAGDANRLLNENLGPKYRWNDEDETVTAFKSLVQRKFAQ